MHLLFVIDFLEKVSYGGNFSPKVYSKYMIDKKAEIPSLTAKWRNKVTLYLVLII
jgi:hypothetical protein